MDKESTETNQLTLTLDGSKVNIDGATNMIGLLSFTDALLMLCSEKLGLPMEEVLDNFRPAEEDEAEVVVQ